ncbi:hypothetical protein [Plantactinospora sp. GCM10030261]|uniref:hypothetical protein n=1 Tax=Plantactinospora sp. GCM10030261 TaxID=3273420 RepID=UPI00360F84C2
MRRTRALTTAVVALTMMVTGCTTGSGGEPTTGGSTPPTTSADDATAAPTGPPSPTGAAVIPASALLQATDLGGTSPKPAEDGDNANLRPLRPCDARYPSDATRTAAVAMKTVASPSPGSGETPNVVLQYVGLHPGRAKEAYADIVAAIQRCPGGLGKGQYKWETAGSGIAGDESLLVRMSERVSYGDADPNVVTVPVVLARVGDHLLVLADLGWENAGGSEEYVRALAPKAVDRLRTAG